MKAYHLLTAGQRFRLPDDEFPHYLKVRDDLADVCPAHRLHPKAPRSGFRHMEPARLVTTFEDLPLAVRFRRQLVTTGEAMLELARSFPSMQPFYGSPTAFFDPDPLCLAAHRMTSQEAAVARFLLELWNRQMRWPCGRFHFVDSVENLEPGDRAALAAWLSDPWFP